MMNFCRVKLGRGVASLFKAEKIISSIRINRSLQRLPSISCFNKFQQIHHFSTDSKSPTAKRQTKQKPSKLILKTPKGTCDHGPQQMVLRQSVFQKIESIFQSHGAQAIDTPVFELKEILTGKYGEDSKLIYDLEDQGGESLSLRYDLTVPLARYLAMNKINSIKRYHIAKVYRRDSPSIAQGRLREFYQCDFDIVGAHDAMLPEIECVKVVSEVLKSLDIGEFIIRLNHRELLNGLFEACGVPADKFRTICSAVDKLDKSTWSEVRKEMIVEKGLNENVADNIGRYTQQFGHAELIEKLVQDEFINKFPSTVKALQDLKLLLRYCDLLGIQNQVIFDLSLARGLDYYTGVIFEAVLKDKKGKDVRDSIGSIAAGGRYDDLIGMFDEKGHSVPCVGVSIGVERIFSILRSKMDSNGAKHTNFVDVYVISAHNGLHEERLKLVNRLWNAGIRSEHSFKQNPKILKQIEYCEKYGIPFAIIVGDSELQRNVVKLRTISTREETEIPIEQLEIEINKRFNK